MIPSYGTYHIVTILLNFRTEAYYVQPTGTIITIIQ